jgi:hypothetical protein
VPAFSKVGSRGETFDTLEEYLGHLRQVLPESYLASSDFRGFVDRFRKVEAGEMTADEAAKELPSLRRVAGTCPCSKSVRWVVEAPAAASGSEATA